MFSFTASSAAKLNDGVRGPTIGSAITDLRPKSFVLLVTWTIPLITSAKNPDCRQFSTLILLLKKQINETYLQLCYI